QIASRSTGNAGRTVGNVYAFNTLGSILGSFFGGLVLLPLLQIQSTLEVMALLYALPGVVLFALSPARRDKKQLRLVVPIIVALVAVAALAPRWDKRLMCSGIYLKRIPSMLKAAREFRILDALP